MKAAIEAGGPPPKPGKGQSDELGLWGDPEEEKEDAAAGSEALEAKVQEAEKEEEAEEEGGEEETWWVEGLEWVEVARKDPRSCVGKWEERFFVLSGGAIPKVCSFKKKRSLWEIGSRRGEFAAVALQALDRDSMLMRGVGRPAGLLRLRGGLRAAAGEHQGCQLKGSWGFYRTPSHPVEDPLDPLQIGKAP